MTSRILCTLDRNACGPGLTIDEGGLIVTTNAQGLDLDRAVHGNVIAREEGIYSFEFYHYSQSRGDLSGLVSVGISEPTGSLDSAVGDEAASYGYRPADGEIWNDGESIQTVDVTAERICIEVYLILSSVLCMVAWRLNGVPIHTVTLPNGKAWVPAISLGSSDPGDISVSCNFGQARYDSLPFGDGWGRKGKALSTIYIASEGYLSADDDTPANKPFRDYVLNAESFSVKRDPSAWVHSGGRGAPGAAAFATLRLDNSDGAFNALLSADVRDSTLVFQTAPASDGSGSLLDATTSFTAIIDSVRAPTVSTVELRLRDTLSRLDKPLPCRIIPPFADEASRGRIYPVGLGAQRNVQPLLFDAPNRIYILGDAPQSNIALVSDGGRELSSDATPPQWTAALNGQGIALETDAQMRLAADCSTIGDAVEIPGAEDVLEGLGEFTTWDKGVPDGWDQIGSANGSIAQVTNWGVTSALAITSRIAYNENGSVATTAFGYWVKLTDAVLEPGRTYRFAFKMPYTQGQQTSASPISTYGLAILTGLSHHSRYWVTPHKNPLSQALPASQSYSFVYRAPGEPGADPLPIYLCVFSDRVVAGLPPTEISASVVIDDLRVELLGQYVSVPLDGMTLTQAFREILVNRAGESESVFSSEDTEAIDAATGITIGFRREEPPNILDALQEIADTYCAAIFTDASGVIRIKQFADPESGVVVADFTTSNVRMESIERWTDEARGLTTAFGARRNQKPFGASDFVTDTDAVPATQREQWQGVSQFRFTSGVTPTSEYSFAVGAPRFHMLADDPVPAKAEANRVVSLYAPHTPVQGRTAAPAQERPGKRQIIQFEAFWDGDKIGVNTLADPHALGFGDVIALTLPIFSDRKDDTVKVGILSVERFDLARRIIITGHYS